MSLTEPKPPTLPQQPNTTLATFVPQEEFELKSLHTKLRSQFDEVLEFCSSTETTSFAEFEDKLFVLLNTLGCMLVALFLRSHHEAFDLEDYLRDCPDGRLKSACRHTLVTRFGKVAYWRRYVETKTGRGFYPLDIHLQLFADSFSPTIVSFVTRLATRVSLKTATLICSAFLNWSPSQRTIGELVLGLGRHAGPFMEQPPAFEGPEGDIIVIEIDGKATPTATAEELEKRRGPRQPKKSCPCGCQRHRGKQCRLTKGKRKRRKKGDKSKNGRSITLVAVYTLRRGDDGLLHGPFNKRVWGSYAPRAVMMDWAKKEVERRGFDPNSNCVHIVSDGELSFDKGIAERFPNSTHALDIRHVEEKLWEFGRLFYPENSEELTQWVEKQREALYQGKIARLLKELRQHQQTIAARGPGTKAKREKTKKIIGYLEKRQEMMAYGRLLEEDLVIASGVIEGAARYVIGERMDCSGMRWIRERAEMLLHLRCIELNGEWERFFRWARDGIAQKQRDELINFRIRTSQPPTLPEK